MKRAGATSSAQRLQRRETKVNTKVVRTIDRAGQHKVGCAVVQLIACEFDGVQTARTGSVDCEDTSTESERSFEKQGWKSGIESITGIGVGDPGLANRCRSIVGECTDGGGLGKGGHSRRRERQIAKHRPKSSGISVSVTGIAKRFTSCMKRPLEHRIKSAHLFGRQRETSRVEVGIEVAYIAASIGPGSVDARLWSVAHDVARVYAPAFGRDRGDQIGARHHRVPQLFGTRHAGEHAGPANNRYRGEMIHASTGVLDLLS